MARPYIFLLLISFFLGVGTLQKSLKLPNLNAFNRRSVIKIDNVFSKKQCLQT